MGKGIINRKNIAFLLILSFVCSLFFQSNTESIYAGISSYENAKTFYDDTTDREHHSDVYNGCFYMATCANLSEGSL